MISPIDLLLIGIVGALLGVLGLSIFIAGVWTVDLIRHIKDGVPVHRRVWLVITITPKHIYHQTDWGVFVRFSGWALLIGAVVLPVVTIFVVGFVEVFV